MSQNPSSQKVKTYTFSSIALIALIVALRCINFLCIYDPTIYYFNEHPLHTVYQTLCVLTVLWLLSMLVFVPRYAFSLKITPTAGVFARSMGLFCGCASAASFFFFRNCMTYYATHAKFYQILSLFCLASAAYFLLQFSSKATDSARALCGYLTLLWLGLILSVTYLNLYVPMNSPFKVTLHVALIAMMLHVLEDTRRHAGGSFRIQYYAYTLIAILCCGVASFPVLLAYFLNLYPNVDYLFYAVLMLGLFLYLCARALDCYRMLMTAPPATPEEIEEDKKKRTEKKKSTSKTKKATDSQESEKGDNTHVS